MSTLRQITVLQLYAFLNGQPRDSFASAGDFRKLMGALKETEKQLGEYLKEYVKHELAVGKLMRPYRDKSIAAGEDKSQLSKIQLEADADKEVQKTVKAWEEFQKKENEKPLEFAIKNPEYALFVKNLLEKDALKFKGWLSNNVIEDLFDHFEIK